jgi:hypothetical protein
MSNYLSLILRWTSGILSLKSSMGLFSVGVSIVEAGLLSYRVVRRRSGRPFPHAHGWPFFVGLVYGGVVTKPFSRSLPLDINGTTRSDLQATQSVLGFLVLVQTVQWPLSSGIKASGFLMTP